MHQLMGKKTTEGFLSKENNYRSRILCHQARCELCKINVMPQCTSNDTRCTMFSHRNEVVCLIKTNVFDAPGWGRGGVEHGTICFEDY